MTSLLGFDIGEVKGSSKAAKNVYAQIMNAVDLLCEMPDLGNLITRNRHSHSLTIASDRREGNARDISKIVRNLTGIARYSLKI